MKVKAPVKEALVALMVEEGFGVWESCEWADSIIKEMGNRAPGVYTYGCGARQITLEKK